MCTGLEIAALAATAGGTYMQSKAASDANNQRLMIARQAEEENQRINKAGEETVNDFAEKTFGAENRDERYEEAAQTRETSLAEALSSARTTPEQASGNVSSDYLQARQTSDAGAQAEAAKRAKLLARTGATSLMYGQEGMMGGQLSSDLAGLSDKSRRNSRYAQNAAGNVNGDSLAGGLLAGLGGAGLSSAASKPGAYGGIFK